MLVPVCCFSCCASLGHVAELFRVLRRAQVERKLEEKNTAPEMAAVNPEVFADCRDIFEALQVRPDCCRAHLSTSMDLREYY